MPFPNPSFEDGVTDWENSGAYGAGLAGISGAAQYNMPSDGSLYSVLSIDPAEFITPMDMDDFMAWADMPEENLDALLGQSAQFTFSCAAIGWKGVFTITNAGGDDVLYGGTTKVLFDNFFYSEKIAEDFAGANDYFAFYVEPYPVTGTPGISVITNVNELFAGPVSVLEKTSTTLCIPESEYQVCWFIVNIGAVADEGYPSPFISTAGVDNFRTDNVSCILYAGLAPARATARAPVAQATGEGGRRRTSWITWHSQSFKRFTRRHGSRIYAPARGM